GSIDPGSHLSRVVSAEPSCETQGLSLVRQSSPMRLHERPKIDYCYLGYRTLPDGGREFDFSFEIGNAQAAIVTIDAPITFFRGPDQLAIQEPQVFCYETLRFRLQASEASPPGRFDLTPADVAQHRRSGKHRGGRR